MLVRWLVALAALASACASPTTPAKPDFTACRGFLEAAEVAQVTGLSSLEPELRPITRSAQAQTPSIQAYCQITFYSPGRAQAITLGVIRYDSAEAAQAQYQRIVDGFRFTPSGRFTRDVLGEGSYPAEVDSQGVGSFVGFRRGIDLVQLSTAMPAGGPPPASTEQLKQLAEVVRGRLP